MKKYFFLSIGIILSFTSVLMINDFIRNTSFESFLDDFWYEAPGLIGLGVALLLGLIGISLTLREIDKLYD